MCIVRIVRKINQFSCFHPASPSASAHSSPISWAVRAALAGRHSQIRAQNGPLRIPPPDPLTAIRNHSDITD